MIKNIICTTLSGFLLLTCIVSLNVYRLFSTNVLITIPSLEKIHLTILNTKATQLDLAQVSADNIIHDQVLVWLGEKNSYRPVTIKKIRQRAGRKTIQPKKEVIAQRVDSTNYSINGEEKFQHYGFEHQLGVEIVSFSDYLKAQNIDQTLLAIKQQNTLEVQEDVVAELVQPEPQTDMIMSMMDDVSTQLSAVKVSQSEAKEIQVESNENDLVLIDYSKDDGEVVANEPIQREERDINNIVGDLAVNNDIPESVMMAIQRTMDEPIQAGNAMNTQPEKPKYVDYIAQAPSAPERRPLSSQKMDTQRISRNSIKFYAVDINKNNKSANVANIEFHSDIIPERITDNGTGIVFIEERLNSQSGSIRGTFLSGGYVPTKMDLPIEAGNYELEIPLLSSFELNNFLTTENLSAQGGLLLIQLASTTDNVDIDAYFEAKIYLSSNFKVVEPMEEYEYILFSGVTAGNVLISQRNFRNEVAQKIVHITDDELYFEGGQMLDASRDLISLETINLLGRKNSILDIQSDDIKVFNTSRKSSKLAIGKHEVEYPIQAFGMRKYLEMTHLRGSIFVGYSSNNDLKIPSQELVYHIIDAHGLRSLENTCMIQVNFKNQVAQIEAFGESNKGPMALISTYLDNDGQWGQEPTEMTEHMFIASDERGAISLKVEYLDGSKDYLQTFCSYDTYLVEQL